MLLLDQEKSISNSNDSARQIIIVSKSIETQNKIAQLLRSRSIENIKLISKDFLEDGLSLDVEEAVGVIIDIGDEQSKDTIVEYVHSIVPQRIWCCLIGDSDSISLSQKLLEKSILYFHKHSQLNLMIDKILSDKATIPNVRNTVKICLLSCKGGIGGSFISSQIANQIASYKKVPVLLAQGQNGSRDLDLFFDKKISGDLVNSDTYLDLFIGNLVSLNKLNINKYNFIIYDQPIFNINKDDYSNFFSYSNTFVLIVDRTVNSLRVAKQFLDFCERERVNTGKPIRTFICISDTKEEMVSLMSKADIETLLDSTVDAVIPHAKKIVGKNIHNIKVNKPMQKVFTDLSMKIIGVLSRQIKNDKDGILTTLKKLITN